MHIQSIMITASDFLPISLLQKHEHAGNNGTNGTKRLHKIIAININNVYELSQTSFLLLCFAPCASCVNSYYSVSHSCIFVPPDVSACLYANLRYVVYIILL